MAEIKLRCPTEGTNPCKGCGSENVSHRSQGDNLCDCHDCGLFFSLAEAVGFVEVELFAVDGSTLIVYVRPDTPLTYGSWSVHKDK